MFKKRSTHKFHFVLSDNSFSLSKTLRNDLKLQMRHLFKTKGCQRVYNLRGYNTTSFTNK